MEISIHDLTQKEITRFLPYYEKNVYEARKTIPPFINIYINKHHWNWYSPSNECFIIFYPNESFGLHVGCKSRKEAIKFCLALASAIMKNPYVNTFPIFGLWVFIDGKRQSPRENVTLEIPVCIYNNPSTQGQLSRFIFCSLAYFFETNKNCYMENVGILLQHYIT